jgi:hypothetical protein
VGIVWVDRLEELVDTVQQDPEVAVRLAGEALADASDPHVRSLALWVRGLARREMSDLPGARADLDEACRLAELNGDEQRWARAALSLSLVVASQGSPGEALDLIEKVRPLLPPSQEALAVMQQGAVKYRLADFDGALRDYQWALPRLRRHDQHIAELRLLVNLGSLHAYRREFAAARRHLLRAQTLAEDHGQTVLACYTQHNLGHVETLRGDVPSALRHFAAAEALYGRISGQGESLAILRADRARALLSANVVHEARLESDAALTLLVAGGNAADRADVALFAAEARLRDGDAGAAREAAELARRELLQQDRQRWLPLVDLLQLRASGDDTQPADAELVAEGLRATGWPSESLAASLIAGQSYARVGELKDAHRVLSSVGRPSALMPPADFAAALLSKAFGHYVVSERAAARRSLHRGLAHLADNRLVLGALELRAHAAASGEAFAALGARMAIEDGRPRELLVRIESARGMNMMLRDPAARSDDALAGLLSELRSITEELREAAGETAGLLTQRRRELEALIRDHSRRSDRHPEVQTASIAQAIATLGDRVLLEYANLDGRLFAVSVSRNRATLHELAGVDEVQPDIDAVEFALNRLHRSQGSASARQAAQAMMTAAGERLDRALLPPGLRFDGRPVVVVPTGRLHGLAWRVLPRLAHQVVSVVPSLQGWAAGHHEHVRPRTTALIAGPHLEAASREVTTLARIHPRARLLDVGSSTAERCLDALEHSSLVHFSCHGSFRSDNPLFSSLQVSDGDLTVYDLERCRRLPTTLVISACSVAQTAVLRGGGLLGMTSALIQLGVSSVIAPLTPVSDERSVALMVRLHGELRAGVPPAEALATASVLDGELDPTAAAFVAIGA